MPELPDVEVFTRYFNENSKGRKINDLQIKAPEMLKNASSRELRSELPGREFMSAKRHGKYLIAPLSSGNCFILHFGMTGFIRYFEDPDGHTPYEKLKITFESNGCLVFDCRRKLGEIGLAGNIEAFMRQKRLGPDPLAQNFGISDFAAALGGKRGAIKSTLMNQEVLAGIGNIYSDEILFQAGINPEIKTSDLDRSDLETIYNAMIDVLNTAISCNADSDSLPDGYILTRRKKGGTCPKCGEELLKRKVSGRGAFACPRCQKIM